MSLDNPHAQIIRWTGRKINFIHADGSGIYSCPPPGPVGMRNGELLIMDVQTAGSISQPLLAVILKEMNVNPYWLYTFAWQPLTEWKRITRLEKYTVECNQLTVLPGTHLYVMTISNSYQGGSGVSHYVHDLHNGKLLHEQRLPDDIKQQASLYFGKDMSIRFGHFQRALKNGKFHVSYRILNMLTQEWDVGKGTIACDALTNTSQFEFHAPTKDYYIHKFIQHLTDEERTNAVVWDISYDNFNAPGLNVCSLPVNENAIGAPRRRFNAKMPHLAGVITAGALHGLIYCQNWPSFRLMSYPVDCSPVRDTVQVGKSQDLPDGFQLSQGSPVFLNDDTVFICGKQHYIAQDVSTGKMQWCLSNDDIKCSDQNSVVVDPSPQSISIFHSHLDEYCCFRLPLVLISLIAEYYIVKQKLIV